MCGYIGVWHMNTDNVIVEDSDILYHNEEESFQLYTTRERLSQSGWPYCSCSYDSNRCSLREVGLIWTVVHIVSTTPDGDSIFNFSVSRSCSPAGYKWCSARCIISTKCSTVCIYQIQHKLDIPLGCVAWGLDYSHNPERIGWMETETTKAVPEQ